MLIIQSLISGLLATFIFDLFNQALYFAYGINKPKWNLVGRYFLGYKDGMYFRKTLVEDDEIENELLYGYIIHYVIGLIYGFIYVLLNAMIFNYPSILLAYIFGFLTVLGAWCYMMPFAYNLGFFASKSENRVKILIQNLIAHFVFGTGLFIGLYSTY